MEAQGMIQAISKKENNRFAVKIEDEWFNGFGRCPVRKGDEASVEYEESNNGFNNIQKIERKEEIAPASRARSQDNEIEKMWAIKTAVIGLASSGQAFGEESIERFSKMLLDIKRAI